MNTNGETGNVSLLGDADSEWELKAWKRLLAGMLAEQGLGDKDVTKRWQAMVKSGDFDGDRFAAEMLEAGGAKGKNVEAGVMTRSARLERDLLMTPLLRGASGAGRKMRGAARSGVAGLITQAIVVAIFCFVAFLFMLVACFKGVEFDPFFQSIIDVIPALPESNS